MNLWYINIWLNPETGYDTDYRYAFLLRTRFISNYLSKQIRKRRFKTDGTFHMISVDPTPHEPKECRIVPDRSLNAEVHFDKDRYEKAKDTGDFEYYLELFETGFSKASKWKDVPLDSLLSLIGDFREKGYKNEWRHKKKRFKEQDIEVILDCRFTTNDFELIATINQISTKKELCSGAVITTDPDEVCFDKLFKDILIDKANIVITDAFNCPSVFIDLKDALNKKLSFRLLGLEEKVKHLTSSQLS
jgi:hypothetical protein